ncbi:hypothetical protein F4810DRAFT_712152 [Camillea tinctor]|nr:hypothetical protein F4810DRAFT_712152 [Camillea tinctor]
MAHRSTPAIIALALILVIFLPLASSIPRPPTAIGAQTNRPTTTTLVRTTPSPPRIAITRFLTAAATANTELEGGQGVVDGGKARSVEGVVVDQGERERNRGVV